MARIIADISPFVLMVLSAGTAYAQTYPSKPIRVLTSAVGGGSDFDARVIAQGISPRLGQPVIVDNRGGPIAPEIVSKAPPDGYTLLLVGSNFHIAPLLQQQPYDPIRDFAPVTIMTRSMDVFVVNSSSMLTSVKELIALAKAKPGELNNAAGPSFSGSPSLSAALFKSMSGVNIVAVPYKSVAQALNGVLGSEVQLMFPTASAAMPHVNSGKLRALGITSAEPSALVPGVPPIGASLPGYESVSFTAIYTPAKTPVAIIDRLNQEIVRLVKTAEARETFLKFGEETVGTMPGELAALIRSEMSKWSKVIQDAGIKPD